MRTILGASLLLALMCGTAEAKKAEVAVVGLHISGVDADSAVSAAEQMVDALDRTGRIEVVAPGEVRARLSGREELVIEGTFLGPGRNMLEEGRVLYERADFESAISVLNDAVAALRDGLPGATESKDLIDALLLLGLANAGVGELDSARAAYKQVIVLDPSRRIDPVNYAPKIVALFDEVREQVLALPTGSIEVSGPPGELKVFVDGRRVDDATGRIKDLPAGTHYLLVVGEQGRREFASIELAPGEDKSYLATLAGTSIGQPGDEAGQRSQQTSLLYSAVGDFVETPLVLMGGEVGDGKVSLQLYEPRTETFSRAVTADAGGDPLGALLDLSPTLANYVTDDGLLRTDRVSPQVSSLDISTNMLLASILLDPEPIVQIETVSAGPPWYLWAGVAALAAGGAAAAVVVFGPDSTGPAEPVDPDQGTVVIGPMP